ncbi:hypothetical protein [Oenococcus oeni]|uniref:hypothetical protein n=1 Tax=Oenococcus oeni TaxID=1247 RepID=UPI0010B5805B|nr:hypothetical protein [Oenococcus oeni]SYW19514.1 hypothetical protein OENI_160062 [Oenococcus oeni]
MAENLKNHEPLDEPNNAAFKAFKKQQEMIQKHMAAIKPSMDILRDVTRNIKSFATPDGKSQKITGKLMIKLDKEKIDLKILKFYGDRKITPDSQIEEQKKLAKELSISYRDLYDEVVKLGNADYLLGIPDNNDWESFSIGKPSPRGKIYCKNLEKSLKK